ncbi:relaxase/mobilization nuclease domain-containing protein [Hyphomicrobium sp.]|uniref:relaxase/mobilization nuclease domain-containing protein n=1 Tax=Hyphomicrobium sp. TaxID=82 RepID=UPI002E375097|nr:relaxase/mobilization nuclease domain-containing protein [Hyphomicrobium sp.]HEX2842157.1 relaxase/mobilization nuclease domain-containing protein [Hyphomicrobium sp.]
MIGKIPRPGKGFRGSFNYLMHGKRDDARDPERLAWWETRNLFVQDTNKIPGMMRATAAQSKKCQKPVYHMIISWRPDELPSDVTMREVADRALFDMGLNEHQAVLAAHRDTNHRHLHILVNRVHPETGKAWHTSKDWARFEQSIARQALERGMVKVDGRHNTPEKMARARKRVRDGEYQMEKRLGREVPKDRWSAEEIRSRRKQLHPIFEQARSWDQLSRLLGAEGLTLTAKGQGLVIDDGMGFMKLSDLNKEVRLAGLEALYRERFSDFSQRREMEAAQSNATPPVAPAQVPELAVLQPGHDKSAASETSPARHQTEEAEKDKVRAEWRAKRQHERQSTGEAEDDNDGSSGTQSIRRERAEPARARADAQPRKEAWRAVMEAREKLDLARELHRSRLIDNDDLVRAIDNHAAARDDLATLMQEEPNKALLREEWRQQAESQREAVHARAWRQPNANNGSATEADAAAAADARPQRALQPTPKAAPPAPSPRLEAFRNLSHAHETLDLARQLHGLGLLSKQDLMNARDDVAAARDQLNKHQTFSEFVGDGVRDVLSKTHKAAPAPAATPDKKPPPPPPMPRKQEIKQDNEHDRKKERERDRDR